MAFYDIFNGDADGICALHQLRLAQPEAGILVTGAKRDIALLERVAAGAGDHLTVLDLSLRANAPALMRLLANGASCDYFDHHNPGAIPAHPALRAHIDTSPEVCTSLLVDRHLGGQHRAWAVVAAFGDNLAESAARAAAPLACEAWHLAQLRELGECLNYNAYGETVADLHFHPAELYRKLQPYSDPLRFIAEESAFAALRAGYAEDLARAAALVPESATAGAAVYLLPQEKWARRASGVFGNRLAQENPARAHAVLTETGGGFVVSVRAPLANPFGADELCRRFQGDGRKGAAGITLLPRGELARFIGDFRRMYS